MIILAFGKEVFITDEQKHSVSVRVNACDEEVPFSKFVFAAVSEALKACW